MPNGEVRENEFEDRPELVKKRARALLALSVWKLFWVSMLFVILSILVFDAVQGVKARRELLDCTTPGGECFQESQQRTGAAVAAIVRQGAEDELVTRRILVFALVCVQHEGADTVQKLDRCVADYLEREPLTKD
jgi:hypothetical protein